MFFKNMFTYISRPLPRMLGTTRLTEWLRAFKFYIRGMYSIDEVLFFHKISNGVPLKNYKLSCFKIFLIPGILDVRYAVEG